MVYAGVERLLNGLVRVLLGGLRERGPAEDEHGVLAAKTSQTTVFHAWSLSSLILSSFPFHSQRNHLERPHPEAHGTPMYLHGSFGLFEQIDALHALVGERVGVERTAEQADTHHVLLRAVSVLAVVEERHAVARLGEITEAVCRDLETGGVPGGVVVRRPPQGPEHRLAG